MKRMAGVFSFIMILILIIGLTLRFSGEAPRKKPTTDRFSLCDDGIVQDSDTGLVWAAHDNGAAVTWEEAKNYCSNYRGGGYTDWRMPTVEELATLFDKNEKGYRPACAIYNWKIFIPDKIQLTGAAAWASEDHGLEAECFMFDYGCRSRMFKPVSFIMRALPVRGRPIERITSMLP